MDIVFAMVAIALLLALGGCLSYLWALRDGQFDDLETPALRILSNDETKAAQIRPGSEGASLADPLDREISHGS